MSKPKVKVTKDGPYLVEGGVSLDKQEISTDEAGFSVAWQKVKDLKTDECYSLCRCGKSKNAPFCDGTHQKVKFDGTETASHEPYEVQAHKIEGPELTLCDADDLCAFARFCDLGDRVWRLVEESDDPESKKLCINEAELCPSGRLIVLDKKGQNLSKKYEPQIIMVDDPAENVSGPIWLKGSIPVESASGEFYEIREKQTLCRCGESENKPFCNGAHASCNFRADD